MKKKLKILQLLTQNEGFVAAGYGVGAYVEHMKIAIQAGGYELMEYTIGKLPIEQDLNNLKSLEQDIVFFHSLPMVKNPNRMKIYEAVGKMKGKRVLFLNDHEYQSIEKQYGDFMVNKAILDCFDKIVTFSYDEPAYQHTRRLLGEDAARKKYIHMRHPFTVVDEPKKVWTPAKNKKKMITYMGRYTNFKDPARILRGRYPFIEYGFDIEFRGIKDDDFIKRVADFKYEFNWKGLPIGPSKVVKHIDQLYRNKYDISQDDDLLNTQRDGKIFWFEHYDINKIGQTMSNVAFGAEFFNLPNITWAGDNIEYAQMEIINYGTIGLFDFAQMKLGKMWKDNKPDKSLIDLNGCVGLNKIFDNLQNAADKCEHLYCNLKEYDEMRYTAYEALKCHANPVEIINDLVEQIYK